MSITFFQRFLVQADDDGKITKIREFGGEEFVESIGSGFVGRRKLSSRRQRRRSNGNSVDHLCEEFRQIRRSDDSFFPSSPFLLCHNIQRGNRNVGEFKVFVLICGFDDSTDGERRSPKDVFLVRNLDAGF